MTVLDRVRGIGTILLDLLYPPRCVGCGRAGGLFCDACRDAVSVVPLAVCSLCGRPVTTAGLCPSCARAPPQIDGIRSAALYEEPLRSAIHGLKYDHIRDLSAPLGDLLVQLWRESSWSADLIVPVPLHPRRERQRGYNQAALLAQRLSDGVGVPVDRRSLKRVRYTVSQTSLKPAQRRLNVEGAFACSEGRVRDATVVLVDDVCTTGATLEACSVALRQAGARSVRALTVARAT